MKRITLIFLVSIFTNVVCYSQDIITKNTGEEILVKVLEITTTQVKFKKYENLTGPVYTMEKSDVLVVRYQNGTRDVFNEQKGDVIGIPSTTTNASTYPKTPDGLSSMKEDQFFQGEKAATIYYRGYTGAGTGTLVVSLLSPLIGLAPAIACSSTRPKDRNLYYPKAELMQDPDYYRGYTLKAKKIKQGKVWTNWGIALGVNVVLVLALAGQ